MRRTKDGGERRALVPAKLVADATHRCDQQKAEHNRDHTGTEQHVICQNTGKRDQDKMQRHPDVLEPRRRRGKSSSRGDGLGEIVGADADIPG